MPVTTPGGENAVFIDNVTQFEKNETAQACVEFAASNAWHSVQPGHINHYTYEDIDRFADNWYVRFNGWINNTKGTSEGQLLTMLKTIGLKAEEIPLTNNGPANDEAVRQVLRAGKLIAICAAESSFFDLEIGRPPYSWNTKPYNHCILGTGLITSGPWASNVWVRDNAAVSGGYPPSTRRPYSLEKMQYVSLTAITPSWLQGGSSITMSGLPAGAHDTGTEIIFSNGKKMKDGFRLKYNELANAGHIPHDDLALEDEHFDAIVERSNPSFWPKGGNVQTTRFLRFAWSPEHGVVWTYIGADHMWYQEHYTTTPAPSPKLDIDIASIEAAIQTLKKDARVS